MEIAGQKLGVEHLVGRVVGVDQDEVVENLLGMMLARRHGAGAPGDHVVLVRGHRVFERVECVYGRRYVGVGAQEQVHQDVQHSPIHLVGRFSSQYGHQGADVGVEVEGGGGGRQLN